MDAISVSNGTKYDGKKQLQPYVVHPYMIYTTHGVLSSKSTFERF